MNLTNIILVAILAFMVAFVMTDGFEAGPTALEQHNDMMERFNLR